MKIGGLLGEYFVWDCGNLGIDNLGIFLLLLKR